MQLHPAAPGAAGPRSVVIRAILATAAIALAACSGGNSTGPGGGASVATVEVSAGSTSIEVGETIKLTAIAKDKDGNLVSGKTFAWTSSNEAVAVVLPDGSVTGQTVGSATIFATVDGKSGSVALTVTAATVPTISSVSPSPLLLGQPATITGTNFSTNPTSNVVTIGGAAATVTAAAATSLTVTVPTTLCVPGTAPVQVSVNGRASNTIQQPAPLSGGSIATAVGQLTLLSNPTDFCLQFPASSSSEAYLIGVQSVTESASTLTPTVVGVTSLGSSPALSASFPAAPFGFEEYTPRVTDAARAERWRRQRLAEIELRQREQDQLDYQTMASFVRNRVAAKTRGDVIASAAAASVPATFNVGDEVSINVPDRNGNLCTDFTAITTTVRAVATHSVWLEDNGNPANGYSVSDFQQLATAFETIYGADIGYFGTPPDMGNNGRIVIVVTKEVNKAGVLGFATTADLRPRTGTNSCPSSDETYIFYDIAPDPLGSFGDTYTRDAAFKDGPVLIGHEFVHIIQFGVRPTVLNNQGLGKVWELEGQATLGEEIVGNAYTGRSPGNNYGFGVAFNCANPGSGQCSQSIDANDWYIASFIDLVLYYGFNANCQSGDNTCLDQKILGAPEQCTWLALDNGGPCYPGRDVYGVPWSFYRWMADNYGSNFAGGEQEMMQKMVANAYTGFQTVTDVIGKPIDELLAYWAAALYTDNRLTGTADPRLDFTSWDFSDINSHLRASAQLQPRDRAFTTFTDNVQIRGGSTAYFRLSGARQASSLRVTGTGGAPLLGSMRVFIVRLQ